MSERIVVSFREVIPPGGDKLYLERALDLKKRAEAHGATLCAWSALTFAFEFDPDEIEEAASLAALAQESVPAEERFGAGIAAGEMRTLGDGGGMAKLGWGAPLVSAALLARDARAGEVLIDGALLAQRGTELRHLGFRVSGERRQLLPAARNSSAAASCAGLGGGAAAALGAASAAPAASARAPAVVPVRPAVVGARADVVAQRGARGGDQTAELARQALLQGNMAALDLLLEKLRVTGEHAELVERMAGLVALRRGATAEACDAYATRQSR